MSLTTIAACWNQPSLLRPSGGASRPGGGEMPAARPRMSGYFW